MVTSSPLKILPLSQTTFISCLLVLGVALSKKGRSRMVENPSRTIPIVNIFFILANIVVFIYIKYIVVADNQQLFLQLGFIPYEISHLVDINPKDLVPIPLQFFHPCLFKGVGLIF